MLAPSDRAGMIGFSYLAGVCSPSQRYSVVEDIGGFANVNVNKTLIFNAC